MSSMKLSDPIDQWQPPVNISNTPEGTTRWGQIAGGQFVACSTLTNPRITKPIMSGVEPLEPLQLIRLASDNGSALCKVVLVR